MRGWGEGRGVGIEGGEGREWKRRTEMEGSEVGRKGVEQDDFEVVKGRDSVVLTETSLWRAKVWR